MLAVNVTTEVLTYIHGKAAVPSLPADTLTDGALVSIARLLRSYHRVVQSFDPADYRWPRPIPASFRTGLVSHNDVHPANLVFRDGRAIALIDFDLAGPGRPAWDLAAAARNWVPLQDDQDVTDSRQGRAIERFRTFIGACELTRAERRHVAEAVVANHDWTYAIVTEAAATGHRGFADYWHKVMEPTARTGAGACGISATYLLQQAENMSWVNRCGRSRVDGGSDRDGSATADSSCVASARSH